jgi:WD40 repeat protein
VSASGHLAVVSLGNRVSVFDVRNGEYVMRFSYNLGGTVSSACLSPDNEHLVVVGSNGSAAVGDVLTGQVFPLDGHVQESHGVGWTSDDQLVYLVVSDGGRTVVVRNSDGSGGEIARLEGAGDWLLTASGTMC